MVSGRQVAVVIWIFSCLTLAPDGGAEQLLGEEACDRTSVVLGINSALQSQVILRAVLALQLCLMLDLRLERWSRLGLGVTADASGVLSPVLPLRVLGGDRPGCHGGLGKQLLETGHVTALARLAVS